MCLARFRSAQKSREMLQAFSLMSLTRRYMGKVLQKVCGGTVRESVTNIVWGKSEGEYSSIMFQCLKEMVSWRMVVMW